ncbi:hypothetical protein D3C79_558400 [compost metagenome]
MFGIGESVPADHLDVGDAEPGNRPVHHRDYRDAAYRENGHQDAQQGRQQHPAELAVRVTLVGEGTHALVDAHQDAGEEPHEQRQPYQADPKRQADVGVDDVDDALALDHRLHFRRVAEIERSEQRVALNDDPRIVEQTLAVGYVLIVHAADERQQVEDLFAAGHDGQQRNAQHPCQCEQGQARDCTLAHGDEHDNHHHRAHPGAP